MEQAERQQLERLANALHERCVQVRANGGDVSSDLEVGRLAELYRKARGLHADYGTMLIWGNAQNFISGTAGFGNSGSR